MVVIQRAGAGGGLGSDNVIPPVPADGVLPQAQEVFLIAQQAAVTGVAEVRGVGQPLHVVALSACRGRHTTWGQTQTRSLKRYCYSLTQHDQTHTHTHSQSMLRSCLKSMVTTTQFPGRSLKPQRLMFMERAPGSESMPLK